MQTRRQAHCVFRCEYHIVWIPKYRYKILKKGFKEYLKIRLVEIRKWYPEFEYKEVNIREDHIHLIISFPPKYSIAQVVQIIKQNTSKTLKDKFDFLKTIYKGGSIWSVGYFVATVGLDEQKILDYARYREKEDLGQAKLALSYKTIERKSVVFYLI